MQQPRPFQILVLVLKILLLLTVAMIMAAVYFYVLTTDCLPAGSPQCQADVQTLGAVGDYFGGVLGPVLNFSSFLALLFAMVLQQRQLATARRDVVLTRRELAETARALQAQYEVAETRGRQEMLRREKGNLLRLLERVYDEWLVAVSEEMPQAGVMQDELLQLLAAYEKLAGQDAVAGYYQRRLNRFASLDGDGAD